MADQLPITVVVPAYNAAATLEATLASVAAQTRAPREIVVLDDGSADATVAIARAAGARTISQHNGGLADARNAAIRAASQPWIALLDADDLWERDKLAVQWALHERSPADAAIASDYAYLVDDRITQAAVLPTLAQFRAMTTVPVGDDGARAARTALLAAIVRGNFVLPSSLLLDRRLFDERGEYFCERERLPAAPEFFIGEDYEWLLRVLRHTDVLFASRPLVAYRRSKTSLSADGGRLRYGDVKLGELVRAAPDRYADGAAAAFARIRPAQLAHAGARYLAEGDVVRAHAMFREGAVGGDARNRALALATVPFLSELGRRVFASSFAIWRRGLRPLLGALRRVAPRRGR